MNPYFGAGPSSEETPVYKRAWFIAIIVIILLVIVYYYTNCRTSTVGEKATSKKSKKKKVKVEDDDLERGNMEEEDAENFVVSGGRDDSHGEDHALKDRIHAINEEQRRYVQNAKYSYRYDPREDTAAPAVYSPEAELQDNLYT